MNEFITICVVDDYHDIDYIAKSLPALKLHYHELGTTKVKGVTKYVGLLYSGAFPRETDIYNHLQLAKVDEVEGMIPGQYLD